MSESFTYTVRDAGGLTDTAQLTITIDGRNDAPVGVDDTGSAVEAGGTANGTAGSNATGNVLTNDTDVDAVANGETKAVSAIRTGTEAAGTGTSGTVGAALTGTYGSLTLNTNGTYTYVIDDSNAAVQALRITGQTLSESFTYTVRDAGGLTDTAQLTITIDGRNDAPVGVDDTGSAVEAGGTANGTAGSNATGNVLTNDTDVDAVANGETKAVSAIRTGTEAAGTGTSGTVGAALTGTYGSLTLNADGSYTYVVTESNPTVEALRAGQSLNEVFTYTVQDAGGLTDTAQLTITINGANDFPVARADTHFVIDGVSDAVGNVLVSANHGGVFADQADTDVEADTLTVVKVNGSAGNVGVARAVTYGTITLAADGSYRYVLDVNNATVQALPPDHTLVETVSYQVSDGQGGTADTTLSITIYGRNNEPTGANHTIVATEDTPLVVHTADFGFADVDSTTPANEFAGVRIDTLPATGTLSLNGVAVTAGQLISKADLDAGKLSYLAPHNLASLPGQSLSSFTFSVRDGLGAYDLTSRTMSVEVNQVSDAPDLVTATADGSNNQPNQPIPLSITIALTDTNGPAPETLGPVTISGLPGGVTLSNTAGDLLTIVNGSITLTVAQLAGLKILPGVAQQTDFTLQVTATSIDGAAAPAASFAPLLVIVPLPPRIPLSPVEEKKSGGYYGERHDQVVYATYPPVLGQLMSPDLHVQLAVRESAKAIQQEAAVTDGALDMPGSEVGSESLQIGRGMPHSEHVGRDGVEYSKLLLGDSQRRTRGIGNSLVVGAATLFNDFAATGGADLTALFTAATDAGTVPAEKVAAVPAAQADADAATVAVSRVAATSAVPRGAPAFTAALAQAAAGRQLVHEGRTAVPMLKPLRTERPAVIRV